MQHIVIYADGGSRGNPGPSGAGAVVFEGKEVIAEVSLFLGTATNNIAEYTAILEGLKAAKKKLGASVLKRAHVEVRMDSELVIRQLLGRYKVKHPNLKPLFAQVQAEVEKHFPNITYTHVPRDKNAYADRLANDAMDKGA
jgi:ribonuclease HI